MSAVASHTPGRRPKPRRTAAVFAALAGFALATQGGAASGPIPRGAVRVPPKPQQQPTPMRVYAIDCGNIGVPDLSLFADTGNYDGLSITMSAPCWLIQHGKDWMLWDLGLGDDLNADPKGKVFFGLTFRVPHTLRSQLTQLGLKPEDISYVGLSHLHADHVGNVGMFPRATYFVSPTEVAWATGKPAPIGVLSNLAAAVAREKITPVPGDLDIFGDGSVVMISTPGHTPGHHSLVVKLPKAGKVIISGDVAHLEESYRLGLVPPINDNRAETVASIARAKGLSANDPATVYIHHDMHVFESLPKFPAYLE